MPRHQPTAARHFAAAAAAAAALLGALAGAATTPWVLGDEAAFQCYTLDTKEDIATPRGVSVSWVVAPATDMVTTRKDEVQFRVAIRDSFWAATSTTTLLGGAENFNFFRRVCTAETNPNCTSAAAGECCVTHANIHSCRSDDSVCEPWIKPKNATDGGGQVLVTHTPAQVGGAGTYTSTLQLPEGTFYIIGHFKIMNFQCAVGASRLVKTPPPPAGLSTAALSGVIAGAVLATVLLALGVGLLLFCLLRVDLENVRDTRCAPKDGEVTVIFTDVQSSTMLWAEATVCMGAALEQHHDIIRRAIVRHKAYEVKTIGDAFMIATSTARQGQELCRDIQLALHSATWPVALQELYSAESPDDVAVVDDPAVADCFSTHPFNGLRVRIGIHTGAPSVVFDEVTKGYDYYGPDINVAARVEGQAAGGQIIASIEHVKALSRELGETGTPHAGGDAGGAVEGARAVPRPTVQLKGVSGQTDIYEIVINALPDRVYATPEPVVEDDFVEEGDGALRLNRSYNGSLNSRLSKAGMSVASGGTKVMVEDGTESVMSRAAADLVDEHGIHRGVFNARHPLVRGGRIGLDQLVALAMERRAGLDALLKPIRGKSRGALVKALCDGWRVRYRSGNEGLVINEVLSRAMLADKALGRNAVQKGGTSPSPSTFTSSGIFRPPPLNPGPPMMTPVDRPDLPLMSPPKGTVSPQSVDLQTRPI